MKTMRKLAAIGACGLVIGGAMSLYTASPASAVLYARCDQRIATAEAQAANNVAKAEAAYAKAVASPDNAKKAAKVADAAAALASAQAEYANVLAESAYHRELWGC